MSYACWLRISKCLFLSVVRRNFSCFWSWKKSHRNGVRIKRMVGWHMHFCGGWWLLVEMREWYVFSLEVTLERVCWPCKWNVKKRKSAWRRSIYRKYLSRSSSKNAGWNSNVDVVLQHWPRGYPGQWFSETEYLTCVRHLCFGNKGHNAHF